VKKTRKYVNKRLDIYMEGRKAAEKNEPRFAPYAIYEFVRTWFAGYDSLKTLDK
jgi:hypothetical protein